MRQSSTFLPSIGNRVNHASNQAKNLISAWPCNDRGGLLVRASNPNLNGTFTLGTGGNTAAGKTGRSVRIGTAGSSRVAVADTPALRPAAFTVMAWFRRASFATAGAIVSKPTSAAPWSSPFTSWLIRVNNSTTIEYGVGAASFGTNSRTVTTLVTYRWYHVALSFDPGFSSNQKGDYLNGRLLGNGTLTSAVTYAAQPFIIGADHGASPFSDYLNGDVMDVRLYNRALTAGEILECFETPWDLYYPESRLLEIPLVINGTATLEAANESVEATGSETIVGTGTANAANESLSATGSETINGTATAKAANETVAATGSETITGTATTKAANESLAATGSETITGTATLASANQTVDATGTVGAVASKDMFGYSASYSSVSGVQNAAHNTAGSNQTQATACATGKNTASARASASSQSSAVATPSGQKTGKGWTASYGLTGANNQPTHAVLASAVSESRASGVDSRVITAFGASETASRCFGRSSLSGSVVGQTTAFGAAFGKAVRTANAFGASFTVCQAAGGAEMTGHPQAYTESVSFGYGSDDRQRTAFGYAMTESMAFCLDIKFRDVFHINLRKAVQTAGGTAQADASGSEPVIDTASNGATIDASGSNPEIVDAEETVQVDLSP